MLLSKAAQRVHLVTVLTQRILEHLQNTHTHTRTHAGQGRVGQGSAGIGPI